MTVALPMYGGAPHFTGWQRSVGPSGAKAPSCWHCVANSVRPEGSPLCVKPPMQRWIAVSG